jgi:hypothetical protein
LQAGGHRFDPDRLHHALTEISRDEDASFAQPKGMREYWGICPLFDIVNGFRNRCRNEAVTSVTVMYEFEFNKLSMIRAIIVSVGGLLPVRRCHWWCGFSSAR